MIKNFSIILLVMAMLLGIPGCGEKKDDLTGKWESEIEDGYSASMEFFSDGSGLLCGYDNNEIRSYDCTWVAENGRFKITVDYGISGTQSFSGSYELDKNILKLYYDNDSNEYIYFKE